MLQLRPNCECCNRDLPPESGEALICSFECTEVVARPRRPADRLGRYPASTERVYKPEGCKRVA